MIMKRGLLQIVLTALLLVAQHGALAHQIRHLQDNLPAQSQHDGKQIPQSGLCDFHVSFVQLLGAVDASLLILRIAANAVEHRTNHFPPAFPSDLFVPSSRGPPVFL